MKVKTMLVIATAAGALLASAAPSYAAGARLCGNGEVGVVVFDEHGDKVTVCVRP